MNHDTGGDPDENIRLEQLKQEAEQARRGSKTFLTVIIVLAFLLAVGLAILELSGSSNGKQSDKIAWVFAIAVGIFFFVRNMRHFN